MFWLRDTIHPRDCEHFITHPGERLIAARRQSSLVLMIPYLSLLFVGAVTAFTTWWVFVFMLADPMLLITWLLLEFTLALLIALQVFYGWYYHIYLFTSHKIVEIIYSPPFLRKINDILLDQVRVTEVNVTTHGFFREFLDIGDIIIGFDRLSHDEHILLTNLHKPHDLGEMLSQQFEQLMQNTSVWFGRRNNTKLSTAYKFPAHSPV